MSKNIAQNNPDQRSMPSDAFATISDGDSLVARRAYELFEQRGGEDGHDLEDWLQAEAELRSQPRELKVAS